MMRTVNRKRWIALVAALLLGTLLVWGMEGIEDPAGGAGPWHEEVIEGEGFEKIAVVPVRGEITSEADTGAFASGAVTERLISQLRQAREDEAVHAVILRLNTPGGSVVASNAVVDELRSLRSAGKPVVASMGEVAASGGYLLSAASDHVIADPATITGSIGVIMVLLNLEEAGGKLGVEPVILKAGRHKDMGSPFRDLTARERRMFQDLLDESHDAFVETVAEGRDMSPREVRDVADGRIFSGQQAERLGLVDELGGFDHAIDAARSLAEMDEALVVEYQETFSLLDMFRGFPRTLARSPVEEVERSFGATGPRLAYLYVP